MKKIITKISVALALLLSFNAGAQTLDQTYPLPGSMSTVNGTGVGQSFTAGLSGPLSKITISIKDQSPTASSSDIRVRIIDGAGTCGATILADETFLNITENQNYSFILSTPPVLVSGQTYTIRLTSADGSLCNIAFGGGYASGDFYSGISCTPFGGGTDFWFETYVTVAGGAVANTKLHSKSCGITVADLATPIYANSVPSATAYTFNITNTSLGFTYNKTVAVNYFRMDQIPGVLLNTPYSVKVKATVGAATGTYSDSCTVTTPNTTVPNTKLQSTQCGVQINSFTTPIYASPVAGATVYYFQVTNTQNNFVQNITSYSRYFKLSQLQQTWGGVIHSVRVKVKVGTNTGNFGPACTITDGANPFNVQDGATLRLANNEEGLITPSTTLSIYPNPNSGEQLNVSLENLAPNSTLTITDIYGKTIVSKVLNTDLSEYNVNVKFDNKLTAGLYFITLTSNENRIVEKLVVR